MKKINLYVNGDSHTAGTYLENLSDNKKCFSALLANRYDLTHTNEALAGGSNNRIIRLSKEHLRNADPTRTVVLIGWSTFERTEWHVDGQWHQICGQPLYEIKIPKLKKYWKDYTDKVWNDPNWTFYHARSIECQHDILDFHHWLKKKNFKHLFFHAHKEFTVDKIFRLDWPGNIWLGNDPYNASLSFTQHSLKKGHSPDAWYHFDYDAHKDYADFIRGDFEKILMNRNQ